MLIKAPEAAKILGVNTPRLYQLVRENILPYVRLGERQIRFNQDALQAWIDRGGLAQTNGNGTHAEQRSDEKVAA